jgi:hypothetical protein
MTPPTEPTIVPTLRRRLRAAVGPSLLFGGACALVLLLAVGFSLYSKGFAPFFTRTGIALLVLALPPALVAALAAYLIDCLLPHARKVARGLLMGFALIALGSGASAAAFNLVYRLTYPGEFAPFLSKAGLHEAIWTGISTTYLFLISAPLLYWPWGLIAALALAAAFALRRPAMGRFAHHHH